MVILNEPFPAVISKGEHLSDSVLVVKLLLTSGVSIHSSSEVMAHLVSDESILNNDEEYIRNSVQVN